jgi:hypothetical protein
MMLSIYARWNPFITESVTNNVVTPRQIPSTDKTPVAGERDFRSMREKRRDTKTIHRNWASGQGNFQAVASGGGALDTGRRMRARFTMLVFSFFRSRGT